MARAQSSATVGSSLRRPRGLRDQRGLSTVEYVIILICIAVIGIYAWRLFGSSTRDRTAQASGEVAGLEATPGQGGPRGGGIRVARTSSSALDDATADATPPDQAEEGWVTPAFVLGLAAVVILAVIARNFRKRGGGDGGGGGGGGAAG